MSLVDFLRKIGVLRYGKKTYEYTSGRDLPPEALMHDVYDANKDLVTGEDLQRAKDFFQSEPKRRISPLRMTAIFGGLVAILAILVVIVSLDEAPNESVSPTRVASDPVSVGEINSVFVKLRQANLDEDIDAFMKYYADSFPDRSGKRQKTLASWKQYDYASLEFFVFDLAVDGNQAKASIGWEIALLEKGKGEPQLLETTNEVVLEKGRQGWQIIALQ